MATQVKTYSYPRIMTRSSDFSIRANGKEVAVLETSAGPFAAFSCDGPVEIEIGLPAGFHENLRINGVKATSGDDIYLFTTHASGIVFR